MSVGKSSNFGNPNIGLYAKVSEKLVLADASSSPKLILALSVFGLPVHAISLGGSDLCGLFIAMNSNGVVLPKYCGRRDVAFFKGQGLNVAFLDSRFSAVGNNIAANDFGAVLNPEISNSEEKKISECLGVEAVRMGIAGHVTTGSCAVATNKGFIAHNRATSEELKELKSIFRSDGENCTMNAGIPFVSLGAVANSHNALFGEACTGFEIGRAYSCLVPDGK